MFFKGNSNRWFWHCSPSFSLDIQFPKAKENENSMQMYIFSVHCMKLYEEHIETKIIGKRGEAGECSRVDVVMHFIYLFLGPSIFFRFKLSKFVMISDNLSFVYHILFTKYINMKLMTTKFKKTIISRRSQDNGEFWVRWKFKKPISRHSSANRNHGYFSENVMKLGITRETYSYILSTLI